MFDLFVEAKAAVTVTADLPLEDKPWNVGLITAVQREECDARPPSLFGRGDKRAGLVEADAALASMLPAPNVGTSARLPGCCPRGRPRLSARVDSGRIRHFRMARRSARRSPGRSPSMTACLSSTSSAASLTRQVAKVAVARGAEDGAAHRKAAHRSDSATTTSADWPSARLGVRRGGARSFSPWRLLQPHPGDPARRPLCRPEPVATSSVTIII